LAVAAVYGQDQFELHAQSPSLNSDGIIQHRSKRSAAQIGARHPTN
jgi:hypothetical protein